MRFSREQYLDLMTFKPSTRPMFTEIFGPLIGLPQEWQAQGATAEELNLAAFDWDYVERVGCGGDCGGIGDAPVVVEEDEHILITRDYLGRTMKLDKRTATLPLPMDFPVRTMDDWLKVKQHFVFTEERVDLEQAKRARQQQQEGKLVIAAIPGAFDMLRNLMGEENTCLAYFDQPELVNDILQTLTDTAVRTLDSISEQVTIDILFVHEDFAGKSGPLVGPSQVKQTFEPYYRAVWDMLSSRGTTIFDIDSDGDVGPVFDQLIDAGINTFHPVEPAAGMDPVKIREQYGNKLAMYGGIDKHILRQSKNDIRKELEYKMQPSMREGGMVFALDHRIPDGTPLENYRYYVDTGREILGIEPRAAGKLGPAYAMRPGG